MAWVHGRLQGMLRKRVNEFLSSFLAITCMSLASTSLGQTGEGEAESRGLKCAFALALALALNASLFQSLGRVQWWASNSLNSDVASRCRVRPQNSQIEYSSEMAEFDPLWFDNTINVPPPNYINRGQELRLAPYVSLHFIIGYY